MISYQDFTRGGNVLKTNTDYYLRNKEIEFSIDEIILEDYKDMIFGAVIIPKFEGTFFPPHFLRKIKFEKSLLTKDFFNSILEKVDSDRLPIDADLLFHGDVIQGGYYKIKTEKLSNEILRGQEIVTETNNIFRDSLRDPPYNDSPHLYKNTNEFEEINSIWETKKVRKLKNLYLYCFNVGQGDTLLLITPNGNVFIIDMNFYSKVSVDRFISKVKEILHYHGLPPNHIKSLIVTHKHIDHLRGASYLIEDGDLEIGSFLLNHGYSHSTQAVEKLLNSSPENPHLDKCGSSNENY